jgi:hypothetical protein
MKSKVLLRRGVIAGILVMTAWTNVGDAIS